MVLLEFVLSVEVLLEVVELFDSPSADCGEGVCGI